MITLKDFINEVVDVGIEAAKSDYSEHEDDARLKGSVDGLNSCRGKMPSELLELLHKSITKASGTVSISSNIDEKYMDGYWYLRCFELEVEWVCNCVSAVLMNEGKSVIIQPTARGVMFADKILKKLSKLNY